jgi:hypothetical protein
VSSTIDQMDPHKENVQGAEVPVLHPFRSRPSATQDLLEVDGEPCLCEGDEFRNESSSHRAPQAGVFPGPTPPGRGAFTTAGQATLEVDGKPVMVLNGRFKTCVEFGPDEFACRAGVSLSQEPSLEVESSSVLTGQPGGQQ